LRYGHTLFQYPLLVTAFKSCKQKWASAEQLDHHAHCHAFCVESRELGDEAQIQAERGAAQPSNPQQERGNPELYSRISRTFRDGRTPYGYPYPPESRKDILRRLHSVVAIVSRWDHFKGAGYLSRQVAQKLSPGTGMDCRRVSTQPPFLIQLLIRAVRVGQSPTSTLVHRVEKALPRKLQAYSVTCLKEERIFTRQPITAAALQARASRQHAPRPGIMYLNIDVPSQVSEFFSFPALLSFMLVHHAGFVAFIFLSFCVYFPSSSTGSGLVSPLFWGVRGDTKSNKSFPNFWSHRTISGNPRPRLDPGCLSIATPLLGSRPPLFSPLPLPLLPPPSKQTPDDDTSTPTLTRV
jgi:hypothetical protein